MNYGWDKQCFHSIMPLENIPSVMKWGILSHNKVEQLIRLRSDISNQDVQSRRKRIYPRPGKSLHAYANLYFDARNPMMYARKHMRDFLCVLTVSPDVLGENGVLVTNQNAAAGYTDFLPASEWRRLDFNLIYAESWTSDDEFDYLIRKKARCAEILVPEVVPYHYVNGAVVWSDDVRRKLVDLRFNKPIGINPHLFFA